jgi:magnesium chelatase family protein
VQKYLNRVSGPLLDRIDLHVEVVPVPVSELSSTREGDNNSSIRERVMLARGIQEERFRDTEIHSNAQMSSRLVKEICVITSAGQMLLNKAMDKLGLSARAYDRILKVSRTIADLSQSDDIRAEHLAEAIQYRSLDRESWAG